MPDTPTVKNSAPESEEERASIAADLAPGLDDQHLRDVVGPYLEQVVTRTDFEQRRENDPVGLVHAYDDPDDREVVAIIASCLAYGKVESLRGAVTEVLELLGPRPSEALAVRSNDELTDSLRGFVYRMTRGADVVDLLAAIGDARREFGSLEQCYLNRRGSHLVRMSAFVQELRARRARVALERGFRYLLPDPADGSATKRLQMFFRWVARGPDGIDLALWDSVSPAELLMPLDTHTSRICRYVGLTTRASTDLKAAIQVSAALRLLRPHDPLYFDFAIAHLGISGRCIHRRSEDHCPGCALAVVCTLEE